MTQKYWAIVSKRTQKIKKDNVWSMIFETKFQAKVMLEYIISNRYYEIKQITIKTEK